MNKTYLRESTQLLMPALQKLLTGHFHTLISHTERAALPLLCMEATEMALACCHVHLPQPLLPFLSPTHSPAQCSPAQV